MKYELNSNKVIDSYSDMINRIAMGYLENVEDCKDIVQDVFLKYTEAINKGKKFNDEEHRKSWIIKVTINCCYNELSSARRRKNVPLEEALYCTYSIESEKNIVAEAMKKLKEKYKRVFELFYYEEFKILEISSILGIKEATVRKRLSRARDKMREEYQKETKINERKE